MTEHDPVNHPTHYASEAKCSGCGEPIECIDVVRHMGFDLGNAIKYLWRAGKKDAAIQDLKKAVWYIEDMIAELEGRKNPNVHRLSKPGVTIINYPPECTGARDESCHPGTRGILIHAAQCPVSVNVLAKDTRACKFGPVSEWHSGDSKLFAYFCETHSRSTRSPISKVPEKCPTAQ